MYGFVYGIVEEDQVLIKPFWEEETITVWGTKEQIADLRVAKEAQGLEEELLIVFYNEETMMLEEEEDYGALAG